MGWGAAIPAVIGAVGSIVGGLIGKKGSKSANKTNLQIAREQMEFQERMSGTAYQRGVKDMQAAGLNPILAYSQGGASSPPGATTRVENAMAPVATGASQAAGLVGGITQQLQTAASTDLMMAQAAKERSVTMENSVNSAEQAARIAGIWAETFRHGAGTRQANEESDRIREAARNLIAERLGIESMSSAKAFELEAMKKGGGFTADVARRVAESKQAQFRVPQAEAESTVFKGMNPFLEQVMRMLPDLSNASKGR